MAALVPVYDSEDDIPEVDLQFSVKIQPYMYEPIRSQGQESHESSDDDSGRSDSDGEAFLLESSDRFAVSDGPTIANENRCTCGNCVNMPTDLENKCCVYSHLVHEKASEAGLACITDHEGFKGNCLNRHVIEMCHYRYNEQRKDLSKCGDIHV
ncbi:uncharacterized protein LOC117317013 [Pecten maximus]|uniref:uncharacterized protein LOC117317013 n=1 Tax=Pecten maximus TaxID=6579 RepID=UPI0014586342|nr:uncharacterized protein LOC117317013 [Pecten maximus]